MRRRRDNTAKERRKTGDSARDLVLPDGIELVATLRGHTDVIGKIAWSPDGSLLATPSRDGTVRVWGTESFELGHTVTGHEGGARFAAFDRHGEILATASDDGTIRFWDVGSWHERGQMSIPDCRALTFSPRENALLAAGLERTALFEVPTWNVRREFDDLHDVIGAAFNPDGSLIALSSFRKLEIWDASDARVISQIQDELWLTCLAFAPHSTLVAYGLPSNSIELWD